MAKKIEVKIQRSPSAVLIRSQLELGGYCDDEINLEPSMTNPSLDEPIEALVARLLRGEQVGSQVPPVYDNIQPGQEAAAFAAQHPLERDGADLADVPGVLARGVAAAESLKPKPAPVPATPAPAPVVPPQEAPKA